MTLNSLDGKTNFFENKVSEYALASKLADNNDAFEFSDNF